jgi:hypothetical protein
VGHCIYCGTYSNHLTKEHIIGHGIAGDSLILPKASCRTCADKTRDWETACFRHLWWPFRVRLGAPSSGRQNQKTFILRQMKVNSIGSKGMIDYDHAAETEVSPADFPLFFMTYKLPPPAVLVGRELTVDVNFEVVTSFNEEEFRRFAPRDKDGFRLAPLNPDAFCRMLAKIAHSYAVAELGSGAFRPVLRKMIRGLEPPYGQPSITALLNWVGGDLEAPAESHLHDIQCMLETVGDVSYVVVRLRLFSFMGSPQYRIVVGELTRPIDQLPFLQQPRYTIDVKTALPLGELGPVSHWLRRTGG